MGHPGTVGDIAASTAEPPPAMRPSAEPDRAATSGWIADGLWRQQPGAGPFSRRTWGRDGSGPDHQRSDKTFRSFPLDRPDTRVVPTGPSSRPKRSGILEVVPTLTPALTSE